MGKSAVASEPLQGLLFQTQLRGWLQNGTAPQSAQLYEG